MHPTVSVILNTYNRLDYLPEAIDSILQQSYQDFELLLVDDCSSNPEVLQCAKRYAEKDERVRVIEQAQNGGLSNGRNVGLHNARGQFIALMDDDDISFPERLAKQVSFLIEHPQYGAVGCPLCTDQTKQQISNEQPFLSWDICCSANPMQPLCGDATNASAMFRREALLAVNGWRKWFLSAEDFDMSLRLNEKYPLAVLGGKPLYYYRKGSGNQMSTLSLCWQYALAAIISTHLRRSGDIDPVSSGVSLDEVMVMAHQHQLAADADSYVTRTNAYSICLQLKCGKVSAAWGTFKLFNTFVKNSSKIVLTREIIRVVVHFSKNLLRTMWYKLRRIA